ncbi:hypothetical protein CWD88_07200 [Burkholderia pseudomallei]|uniref:Uncharacterized protein n=1 Tax=Burkholderia pseudomallei TaxID=28450 RepID=A0AAX0UEA6_BURPE|nr:hypothetical protein BHT10_19825 [Burkholderia pseudomallei]PJO66978.1 hypothetical protein CWD88_07200 [Burkholderia pseudomallei]PNW99342.1 hypothetical protein CF640_02130 [Burkholderia pseudomallei]PNX24558.1 hypothetical protein CF645_01705 [Burkholderia pseudomallei]PPF04983.1 hypothetical protein B9D88_023035 [Burkholderia pseudomallei]
MLRADLEPACAHAAARTTGSRPATNPRVNVPASRTRCARLERKKSPGAPPGLFAFMTATPRRRAARRPLICSAAASGAGTDARP